MGDKAELREGQEQPIDIGSEDITEIPDVLENVSETSDGEEDTSDETHEANKNHEPAVESVHNDHLTHLTQPDEGRVAESKSQKKKSQKTKSPKQKKDHPIRNFLHKKMIRLRQVNQDMRTFHWWTHHITYFRVHLVAWILLIFIGAILIYAIERAYTKIEFIDALFVAASAATVTGVSSVNFADFGIASQLVTLALIFSGGAVLESLFPVLLKLRSIKSKTVRAIRMYKKSRHNSDLKIRKCHMLVNDEDAKAGYVEYLAVKRLMFWIIGYFFAHQLVSFFLLGFYCQFSETNQDMLEENGVNAWYAAAFHSISSMNNAGFSPLRDNLVPFQKSSLVLLTLSSMVLAGNVLYPVGMRFFVWCFYRIINIFWPKSKESRVHRYLLKYPRRCGTHMFLWSQTAQLFLAVVGLTLVEFVCILAMDWHSSAFEGLNGWDIVVNGWAQSVFTRTAGFNSINLAVLNPAMLVLYVGMMYISAYPIVISMRKTAEVTCFETEHSEAERKTLAFQAKKMVAWDAGWVFIPWVIICLIESSRIDDEPIDFSIFKILFEIVTAYGTVGLTLGYPGISYSFSGVWTTGSKLMLILVMLMGRHRGLPDRVDKAVNFSQTQYLDEFVGSEDTEMREIQSEDDDFYTCSFLSFLILTQKDKSQHHLKQQRGGVKKGTIEEGLDSS